MSFRIRGVMLLSNSVARRWPMEEGVAREPVPNIQKTGLVGMRAFIIIWLGQVLSLMGTAMTSFVLTIWAWQVTGEATALALVGFFSFAPFVLFSPVAGALVDRWNRKLVMILGDLGACLSTLVVLLLYVTGSLQIWHLCMTGAIAAMFQSFHFPAYSAAVTMILPKEQYTRASGMISMAQSASGVFAPVFGAVLLGSVGLSGVMVVDIVTCLTAVAVVLSVSIPNPPASDEGRKSRGSLLKESVYGFRYIYERPSLLGLLLVFLATNLMLTLTSTLSTPLILARTNNDNVILGIVQSLSGLGGLVGGLLLTVWGGPKRKVDGVLMGIAASSLCVSLFGLGREVYVWSLTAFMGLFMIPMANGASQAIWQAKVAPDIQGRVFSARLLIAQISGPISMLLGGLLADYVFEPAMVPGGFFASLLGGLVGTGPGAGMSLMFVITGVLGVLVGLGGYAFDAIRNVESTLPDHDARERNPTS